MEMGDGKPQSLASMEDVRIERVPAAKKCVFWRYLQFYLYEHAIFTGKRADNGIFEYPWFDAYWNDPGRRWPFWAKKSDDVAALAMVRIDDSDGFYEMSEFFVVNRYRRQGLGEYFAKILITGFKGSWKLNQARRNTHATAFWHRVLNEFTGYTEAPLLRDDAVERVEQRFTVA